MKNYILFPLMFLCFYGNSQNNLEPSVQKVGDLIKATYYHSDGSIAQEGTFNSIGKLHGQWVSYDFNGNTQSQGLYNNGEKVGRWFFWTKTLLKEVDFENSVIVNVNEWRLDESIAMN